jgi:hypothetical protein
MLGLRLRQPTALAPEGPARPHCREERPKRLPFTQLPPYRELFSRTGEETAMGGDIGPLRATGPFIPHLKAGAFWPILYKGPNRILRPYASVPMTSMGL